MSGARSRSLKALTLLRKAHLDRQAGQLVGLRGLETQIRTARGDSLARAETAATVTETQVMPYMRSYLTHIGTEIARFDRETETVTREIAAQQIQVAQAWRDLRVIENVEAAGQRRAEAAARLTEGNLQDEMALTAHWRRKP